MPRTPSTGMTGQRIRKICRADALKGLKIGQLRQKRRRELKQKRKAGVSPVAGSSLEKMQSSEPHFCSDRNKCNRPLLLVPYYIWDPNLSCPCLRIIMYFMSIPYICHFFYTDRIFENQILHPKKRLKSPKTLKMSLKKSYICIFFTHSGKIYT